MDLVRYLLEISGLHQERLQVRWVSATEGQQFAEYVTELTEVLRKLGPLDRVEMGLPLAAVSRSLLNPNLRWLMGMGRQLTEQENVYHERLDVAVYERMVESCATEEYQQALIYEALKAGPQTVRQIAASTGLPIYTIASRLNDLEETALVSILGHEGTSPKFGILAA
jgi:F420-non-reducing hydrogenase iron-sulfur subunit